ncbi:MAG: aminopeptidase [Candidatus Aenigmarchaeota archaeon]|nr:aminopeptidase [Candidatus Aenigmarchaeota archaeon]
MKASLRKMLAKQITSSMNMKKNETLLIKGGLHQQELVEEIALLSLERGIDVFFSTRSDKFYRAVYDRVPTKFLSTTSKMSLKLVDVLNNYIVLEYPKDPKIEENIPHKKMSAAIAGSQAVSKKMDKKGVKWCYVGYPSKELADYLEVKYSLLKKFIFDGMLVGRDVLIKKSEFLVRHLKKAKYVHVTDEFGTNLRLKIFNRRINVDDGFISDKDIRNKDVGGNLPAGEVFIAPIETTGEGVLISPKRRDKFTGKIIENIRLVFKKGKLDLKKTTAEKNENLLKKTIRKSVEIDRKHYKTIRTTNVAELGIGLNPVINKIIGYLLTDEKIGGTIHVAIGKNNMYGGTSDSSLHWDFVTHQGVTLNAVYPNGREKTLIENGKFCYEN